MCNKIMYYDVFQGRGGRSIIVITEKSLYGLHFGVKNDRILVEMHDNWFGIALFSV